MRSEPIASMISFALTSSPALCNASRVRRTISAIVSDALTTSATFVPSIGVCIVPLAASVDSPEFIADATISSAASRFLRLTPPFRSLAISYANVENGFTFAVTCPPADSTALRSTKSGARFVTMSVPPFASTSNGKCRSLTERPIL